MKIKQSRLLENIERYAQIGKKGRIGVERIALSEEDKLARDLLRDQMIEAGLEVHIDKMGNMIGVRKGKQEGKPVALGSHLDSVYCGGRYDGALGVLAALEIIHTLNDHQVVTEKPLALVNFTNEEGVRFAPDMMGSHVYAHPDMLEEIYAAKAYDDHELTVEKGLEAIGYKGDMEPGAIAFDSFFEIHIEQGPVLEIEERNIGVVEMVQGIYWTRYIIEGEANHAGTTPIKYRKNAGYAAGQVIQFVGDYCRKPHNHVYATVGSVAFEPNTVNIVPQKATFTLDLRSTEFDTLKGAQKEINSFIKGLVKSQKLKLTIEEMVRFAPVHFPAEMTNAVQNAAVKNQLTYKRMPSGAGHDAQMMASVCPSTMIFIPSVNGISHNVEEYSKDQDVANGAQVLFDAVVEKAGLGTF